MKSNQQFANSYKNMEFEKNSKKNAIALSSFNQELEKFQEEIEIKKEIQQRKEVMYLLEGQTVDFNLVLNIQKKR